MAFDLDRVRAIYDALGRTPAMVMAGVLDAIQAGGIVGPGGDSFAVAPVLDATGPYATGELLFDLTEIQNAVRAVGDIAFIKSLSVIDVDNQGAAMDVFMCKGAVSLGTKNVVPTITGANVIANKIHRLCNIGTSDYVALTAAVKIATRHDLALQIQADPASRSLYIGGVTRGAPTHTAAGLLLLVGIMWK